LHCNDSQNEDDCGHYYIGDKDDQEKDFGEVSGESGDYHSEKVEDCD
jgi:hypothetical protein